jgi:hypothetical protein
VGLFEEPLEAAAAAAAAAVAVAGTGTGTGVCDCGGADCTIKDMFSGVERDGDTGRAGEIMGGNVGAMENCEMFLVVKRREKKKREEEIK